MAEVFRVRRGTSADAAALAALAARTFADTFGPDNRPSDMEAHVAASYGVAQQTRELSDPAWTTILVESGGEAIAFAQLRRHPTPECVRDEHAVELHRFYVDRPWHGRGVAQQLMTHVHTAAREMGGRSIWLGVWERNPRAIAFYTKAGFHDAGATDFFLGPDRQTDRVMVADVTVA